MGTAPGRVSVTQAQAVPCHMMSLQGSKVIHQSGADALITEEPDVLIGLVRDCGGPGGQPPGLPGSGRLTAAADFVVEPVEKPSL